MDDLSTKFLELMQYSFLVYFLIALLIAGAASFSGKGLLMLGFACMGTPGLMLQLNRDNAAQLMGVPFQGLWAVGLLAILAAAFKWYRAGYRGAQQPARSVSSGGVQSSMVPRNHTNSVSQAEHVRSVLGNLFTEAAERLGVRAEVMESPAHSPSIWIRVLVEVAEGGRNDLSLRASATIVVSRFEFYRFSRLLTLDTDDSRTKRTITSIIDLSEANAEAICAYLAGSTRKLETKFDRAREYSFQLWRPRNKVVALKSVFKFAPWLALAGAMFLAAMPFAMLLFAAAAVAWYLEREKSARVLALTSGKPEEEPRDLLRMDSWQAVVQSLAPFAATIRKQVLDSLSGVGAQAVTDGKFGVAARFQVSEESISYVGLDGKVERWQLVVRLRRAIGFVHIYAYGDDLYVGWDAHLNRGTWLEQLVAHGVDMASGRLARAYTVVAGTLGFNEYDVSDVNFLIEWCHSAVAQITKQAMQEHKIDQEIDFKIVRESRRDIAAANEEKGKQRTSLFRRAA